MADEIYSYTHPTDTAAGWALGNRVLALGEVGYDSTNNELRAGNGIDLWASLTPIAVDASGTVDQTARDLAQSALNAATSKYAKPSDGIPKTDLASGVQTSLGKADTALQSAPVTSVAGKTGDVTVTKSDVGLSNVSNTSDANKPVSTAQATAIAAKYTKPSSGIPQTDLDSATAVKIDAGAAAYQKPAGGVPDTDLASTFIKTVNGNQPDTNGNIVVSGGGGGGAVSSVAGKTGDVTLNKNDVGLSNVNNTADANKPVSTAQASAIDAKYAKPSDGIPKTDLASDVQTSLGKADTAVQPSRLVSTGTGMVGGRSLAADMTIALSSSSVASLAKADSAVQISQVSNSTALVRTSGGSLGGIPYAQTAAADSFAQRGPTGTLTAADPTDVTHLATKKYVDTALQSAPVTSVAGKTGAVSLAKGDVGLGNVDNTSDANKPVSTAQAAALNEKVSESDVYVWSLPNNLAGGGPGGTSIDSTAAANVPRDTNWRGVEGYLAIGRDALGAATRARDCIALGPAALGWGNPGFANIAIGTYALSHVTGTDYAASVMTGSRNIGIGSLAGHFVDSGYRNTFIGRDAGQTVTSGTSNTGIGYRAATSGMAPVGLDGSITNQLPSTAANNTAVGDTSGALWTDGNNVALGYFAGSAGRKTSANVFIGSGAAQNVGFAISESNKAITAPNVSGTYTQSGTTITVTTASASGAVAGNMVLVAFSSGGINSVTGEAQWVPVASVASSTVFTITSPVSQTTSGACTVQRVETATTATTGGANTVIGFQALGDSLNNDGNTTVVGEQAARTATGARNSILGSRAGFNLTSGTDNTFVGYNAGRALATGGAQTVESNTTVIGSGAAVSGSNQVQLGNASTTTYVYGTVQNRSDLRDKADIRDTVLGLDFVNAIRPVDYRWDMREDYVEHDKDGNVVAVHERDGSKKRDRFHHGVIAQELPDNFGGVQDHSLNGGADVMSVGYDEFVAPLIKAVQELSAQVQALQSEVDDLRGN